jgi:hypothetical protein
MLALKISCCFNWLFVRSSEEMRAPDALQRELLRIVPGKGRAALLPFLECP